MAAKPSGVHGAGEEAERLVHRRPYPKPNALALVRAKSG
jgi:hypothetical protein